MDRYLYHIADTAADVEGNSSPDLGSGKSKRYRCATEVFDSSGGRRVGTACQRALGDECQRLSQSGY